ncbi:MAG: phospho-N-acetylmuramoyl-pentapeptide-transferase [Thermosulfidibacteraceae bacterium]|jgi:phospho-N-acetylmuramoyl-pentapeptide-transferase
MLWELIYSAKSIFSPLNVFKYITFRSTYALVTALIVSLIIGPWLIEKLRILKFGQTIKEYGPQRHFEKKGTPTMGGVLIVISVLVAVLMWGTIYNVFVFITLLSMLLFGFIGFVDDYIKVVKKDPDGLRARVKFPLQLLFALFISTLIYTASGKNAGILQVPFFKKMYPDLGVFYIVFSTLVITATTNAVNLTDGLDGLAIVPFALCMAAYSLISYLVGHSKFASYLQIFHFPQSAELTVLCAAFVGAAIGFLWFNAHPAEVFMGDTGSLAIGAALGTVAVLTKHELLLPIFGGIFVIETLSVVIQVGYFKLTGGKRVFKMAPLHHHFEQEGIPESKIIIRFWIISFMFMLIGLSTLKIR